MGLFSRREAPPEPETVLVISDIHLGEDIVESGPESLADYIRVLNRELRDFIAHHRGRGRRLHLVVNGDMLDFLKITDRKEGAEAPTSAKERAAALANTPTNVLWKLSRVFAVHRPLFKELGAFLADGHRITFVEGNHDAELHFPEVRDTLREHLVQMAGDGTTRDELLGRIQFSPWFVASPGAYHIEHGHQYDERCSFAYKLAPYDVGSDDQLATPVSHRAVPYVADLFGDFSTHGVGGWSFLAFLRFIASQGRKTLMTVMQLYFSVGLFFVRQAGPKRRAALDSRASEHRAALRALSESSPYGMSVLERLDDLRAPPLDYSALRVVQLFYFDRFFVAAAVLASLVIGLFWGGLAGTLFTAATSCAGVAVTVWSSRSRSRADVVVALREAASQVARVTGARYVIFGHSHHPERVELESGHYGERASYLNGGSWVTREILRGEAGNGMTYVELAPEGVKLGRWLGAGLEPAVLWRS